MASYVHGTLETDSNDELFGVVPKYLFLMELGHIKEFLGPKAKLKVVIIGTPPLLDSCSNEANQEWSGIKSFPRSYHSSSDFQR